MFWSFKSISISAGEHCTATSQRCDSTQSHLRAPFLLAQLFSGCPSSQINKKTSWRFCFVGYTELPHCVDTFDFGWVSCLSLSCPWHFWQVLVSNFTETPHFRFACAPSLWYRQWCVCSVMCLQCDVSGWCVCSVLCREAHLALPHGTSINADLLVRQCLLGFYWEVILSPFVTTSSLCGETFKTAM